MPPLPRSGNPQPTSILRRPAGFQAFLLSFALACDKAIERPDVEALDGLPAGKVALGDSDVGSQVVLSGDGHTIAVGATYQ